MQAIVVIVRQYTVIVRRTSKYLTLGTKYKKYKNT